MASSATSSATISHLAKLPTRYGDFLIQAFKEFTHDAMGQEVSLEHVVLLTSSMIEATSTLNATASDEALAMSNATMPKGALAFTPLVRVHSECATGDIFGSQKCDCGEELALAMQLIAQEERQGGGGMIIYLRQEGRGIGLFNKVNAYALQDKGYDTVEANLALGFESDSRDYAIVGRIFAHYHITSARLLTNNPLKIDALRKYIHVQRDSIIIPSNAHNEAYLAVKKHKLGHLL